MSVRITAKRAVLTSFYVDLLDILLNISIAVITGSVVMIAELFQAMADLISSALLFVGLKRSRKEIYFWTTSSALVMLLFAATMSFYYGLQRFLHPEAIENVQLAYAALVIAVVSNGYAFLISVKRILNGKSIFRLIKAFDDSPFITTKNTFVLDLMGMSSALVGISALILYQFFGDLRFDGLGAMGIGIVLGILSINLIRDLRSMSKTKVIVKEV